MTTLRYRYVWYVCVCAYAWVCLCVGAAGDISQMTILLIEMTDYSNVQKVIKN